jgi:Abnormal spindle-like microcephaly-assoc'd, ASPM-SPD-2-Hydin/Beta-propeller repeat
MRSMSRQRSWTFLLYGSLFTLALTSSFELSKHLSPNHWPNHGGPALPQRRLVSRNRPRTPRFATHPTPAQNLLFDPVLAYSTFLGGDNVAFPSGAAAQYPAVVFVDASGNLYVAGQTDSANFPVTPGVVGPKNSGAGFLSKLDPTGQSLVFSTYIDGLQGVSAMTVDASGDIYVAGPATLPNTSGIPTLPIPPGSTPFQATPQGVGIIKLNSSATSVLNATYLGGSADNNTLGGLAVDSSDHLYVTGSTDSNDFPTHAALQGSLGSSGNNVFVTVLDPTLTTAVYSTYLGLNSSALSGTGPHAITVDAAKNAYVVGLATTGFPVTFGTCTVAAPATCAFVAKLNPAGSTLLFAAYLGTDQAQGNAVAVDSSQNIYISGETFSGFPEVNPLPMFPSCSTPRAVLGFISEINAAGTLTFSTCTSIPLTNLVLDSSANMYVAATGYQNLPLKNPIQSNFTSQTPFILAINPNTSSLVFSSYLGGAELGEGESLTDLGVDASGNIYAAGYSPDEVFPNFPAFNALQPVSGVTLPCPTNPCFGAGTSAILLKVAPTNAAAAAVAPAVITFQPQQVGTPTSTSGLTVSNLGSAALTVSDATASGDFSIQNGCTTVAPAGGTCDIQVTFTPSALGTRTGTLTITDNSAGSPHKVQLTGTGGDTSATLSPSRLAFNSQVPDTISNSQQVTLTNSGPIALQISHIDVIGPFSETNQCGVTLGAGQGCFITVNFTPTTAGAATGTLTVTDSASDNPQTVSLSGSGAPSLGLVIGPNGSFTATVAAGATARYSLSIGGQGIGGSATVTCAFGFRGLSSAPAGTVCNVPAMVNLSATTASALNVSVTTTARSHLFPVPFALTPWLWALAVLLCLALFTAASTPPSRKLRWCLAAPLLALGLYGCGGGGSVAPGGGTPAGTYTLGITVAKSGATAQTQDLTLTVQ